MSDMERDNEMASVRDWKRFGGGSFDTRELEGSVAYEGPDQRVPVCGRLGERAGQRTDAAILRALPQVYFVLQMIVDGSAGSVTPAVKHAASVAMQKLTEVL